MALLGNMIRRRKLNELIASWIEYRDMVSRHAGQATATPEQEKRFLELKASISSRLPILNQFAAPGVVNQEITNHVRGMTDLMNSQLALNGDGAVDPQAQADFLSRWHEHFLYLNRFKGMEAHQPQAARPARAAAAPVSGYPPSEIHRPLLHGFFNNWLVKFVVRLAILAAVVIIGAKLLNIDLRQAPDWARRTYQEWANPPTASTTGTAGGTGAAAPPAPGATAAAPGTKASEKEKSSYLKPPVGTGPIRINAPPSKTKYSVDGTGPLTSPTGPGFFRRVIDRAAPLVPQPIRNFLRPVTSQWGVETTVLLIGIGLLLIAYMIFGRAR